jgi:hypothetical protein
VRIVTYKGIDIRIWEQSIAAGLGITFWLERPVEEKDISAVKAAIDAGRRSMARDLVELEDRRKALLKGMI